MRKFEYKIAELALDQINTDEDVTGFLDKFGEEGWELCSATVTRDDLRFILKREKRPH